MILKNFQAHGPSPAQADRRALRQLPSASTSYQTTTQLHHRIYSLVHPIYTHQTAEVLLGITGKDFTIIAASKAAMRGATILKATDDKTRELNQHNLMAFSGEAGDTSISQNTSKPTSASTQCATRPPSPAAVSSFVRSELSRALRSRRPYTVNLLLGGYDTITDTPALYWIDYLAALAKVPYAAHGYAQYYCLSILDKHHHPDIGFERGMELLRMCTDELKRRLPVDFKGVTVKVVTKEGIREVEYVDDKPVKSA
ncbi:Proteasome subunit beta type-4 [Coniosporium tulheliwenetii]|uniref:Proteasome subunit beta type-4 n=1 Tax=Coniosporium tulheliwenetii TaxID=3383036 RepID=A0ACC2ZC25_9PEZI|nr:Proteasome subunit beta type-4 [Cladosporium sp. JES 115]